MILFTEKNHHYAQAETNEPYSSVSAMVKDFEPEVDWAQAATGPARRLGMSVEEVLAMWEEKKNESQEYGDGFHIQQWVEAIADGQMIVLGEGPFPMAPVGLEHWREMGEGTPAYANKSVTKNLSELEDGCYRELLVHDDVYKMAGQIDMCRIETVMGVRCVDIDDDKTNASIKSEAFVRDGVPTMFEGVLSSVAYANLWEYAIKISTYAYMMERAGYTVRRLGLTHHNRQDGSKTVYRLPYLRRQVAGAMMVFAFNRAANAEGCEPCEDMVNWAKDLVIF